MGREVAETCMEGLIVEMVSTYSIRFYATKPELASRRIEAIGYQVGHQLSERYGTALVLPHMDDKVQLLKQFEPSCSETPSGVSKVATPSGVFLPDI